MNMLVAAADSSSIDTLIGIVPKVIELSGSCLTAMVSNPIYAFFLATGLVGVGIGLVSRLKHSAQN